ncbi:DM13 domain-containing protein [Daejeonella sp.]|uniref:DM13 domain-containing protein n=1 Tax=Daejeonella sp. TaxID=2805397 RepID=UPI0030BC0311
MKVKAIFISLICIMAIMYGCDKTSNVKLDEMISVDGTLKFAGTFKGVGSENVSGQAKIYLTNNIYMLKLENFSTSNGPDLKVYLSTASSPSEFISLGNLKSTNGNQVYEISGTPDFTKHKFVLIHCERFKHLFGSAELMK